MIRNPWVGASIAPTGFVRYQYYDNGRDDDDDNDNNVYNKDDTYNRQN